MCMNLTADNFDEEVLKSDVPVLVDFWASWCGPCKMFGPVIEEFAEENKGKVKVCKVNIDEHMTLAQKFNVMSVPTVVVFKDGDVLKTSVGVIDKDELCELAGIK